MYHISAGVFYLNLSLSLKLNSIVAVAVVDLTAATIFDEGDDFLGVPSR